MTEIEEAFNQGVAAATDILRQAANAIPPGYGIERYTLLDAADSIDKLKIDGAARGTLQ